MTLQHPPADAALLRRLWRHAMPADRTVQGSGRVCGIGPAGRCPDCNGEEFAVEEQPGGNVTFRCVGCGSGWRYGLGYVWRSPW